MKIGLYSFSDIEGGAARATFRLHQALINNSIDSSLYVMKKLSSDIKVFGPTTRFRKLESMIRPHLSNIPELLLNKKKSNIITSPAFFNSYIKDNINQSSSDIINLHWINHEMLSIEQIPKINKPLVLTLHDMWAFCGAEHYSSDTRWRDGYNINNKPLTHKGFDLNRWTWERKFKNWKIPLQIVCPSQWLANCVNESFLMKDWPIKVIPNTLDTDFWVPIDKRIAKSALNLNSNKNYLMFGALNASKDKRKGFEYLKKALELLNEKSLDFEIILFGADKDSENDILCKYKIHNFGHLDDNLSLRLLYSAANLLIVPSLQEAFGQTASEAHSCGTAVLAFNNTGLSDVVSNGITGSLINVDSQEMANEIIRLFSDPVILNEMGQKARKKATENWSYSIVSKQYKNLYEEILENKIH